VTKTNRNEHLSTPFAPLAWLRHQTRSLPHALDDDDDDGSADRAKRKGRAGNVNLARLGFDASLLLVAPRNKQRRLERLASEQWTKVPVDSGSRTKRAVALVTQQVTSTKFPLSQSATQFFQQEATQCG
jgi:hypothetical protein